MSEQEVPLLDIDTAVNRIGGDRELYNEVAQIYLEDAPELLEKIAANLKILNRETVERNAHSLKSASANVGAERARAAALAIELEAHTADQSRLSTLLSDLRQCIQTVMPLISQAISG